MDDAYGHDEYVGAEPAAIQVNGNFLTVQQAGQPLYVYKRVPAGAEPHPWTSRTHHEGELYALVWIDEE